MKQFLLLLILLTLNNCVDQLSNDIPFTLYNQTDKTVKVLGFDRRLELDTIYWADPIVIHPNSKFTVIRMSGLNENVSNAFYSIIGVDSVNVIFDDKRIKTFVRNPPNEYFLCDGGENYNAFITKQDYLEASPWFLKMVF